MLSFSPAVDVTPPRVSTCFTFCSIEKAPNVPGSGTLAHETKSVFHYHM
jgi:hypothetical protein